MGGERAVRFREKCRIVTVAGCRGRSYRNAVKMVNKGTRACIVITACIAEATIAAAANRNATASLPMTVEFRPPFVCQVSFAGQTFSLPDERDGMVGALRELRRDWRSASIRGGMEAPYRCVGEAIYLAQRAGFKKVGFVAQPPDR